MILLLLGSNSYTFQFLGLSFDWTTIISTIVGFFIVLGIVYFFSRNIKLRPGKRQNVLEWLINFTNGIVKDQIHSKEGPTYGLYIFTLFLFIFIENQLGLFLEFGNDRARIKSITATPLIALTLALVSLVIAHYAGVSKFGFKKYLKLTYFSPGFLFPFKLLDQFTNFLTLGLRIFGNIFAGEILLDLISGFALPSNTLGSTFGFVFGLFLELIWQAFSVFIGAIQAFVFTTLTSVYINQMLVED